MLVINEIFYSIQGESTYAGCPCVFVRLTACDLRCRWCDTPYAFTEGRKRTLDDVVQAVLAHDCSLVEITGGEPLLQADVYPLMERLIGSGRTVLLETGGHVSLTDVPGPVVKIMDVKCPGSGEAAHNEWSNMDRLSARDQVKFVILDRADYEFARQTMRDYDLPRRVAAVLFSPVHGELDPKALTAWVLEDALPVRVQLQIHKYIWGSDAKGV
ncbi:MAG: radical SAM protein [Acidobacteria bacterium]|nr:radical SAM protein [Acidobacteriota bacterium]MBI3262674.1 radical SAM protein [Acidobacteriota bacterium]